ncbi:hypothetical protein PAHAL_2G284100 [Panicum hallii]|uniref:Uncharacterized protein n=1 Tax=Panicum hallii TaxID=206008 RepID=A0A2T8KQM2_9POAL|nr:hypothetical protein PAHAL_2G284100 [Panicum hallii]
MFTPNEFMNKGKRMTTEQKHSASIARKLRALQPGLVCQHQMLLSNTTAIQQFSIVESVVRRNATFI